MKITITNDDGAIWAIHEVDADRARHWLFHHGTGLDEPTMPDCIGDVQSDSLLDDITRGMRIVKAGGDVGE